METEGPTPKFLYAILKQLDLKSVPRLPTPLQTFYISSEKANSEILLGGLELSRLSTGNLQWPRRSHALFPLSTTDGRSNGSQGSKSQKNCEERPERRSQSPDAQLYAAATTAADFGNLHETRNSPAGPLREMKPVCASYAHAFRDSAGILFSK